MESDPIQLEETQTMQAEISKKKRQRTIYVPKTSTVKRRRGKKTVQPEKHSGNYANKTTLTQEHSGKCTDREDIT
jgi:hypothetical protein